MLLRDPKGNVYAIQTEALQQVRATNPLTDISCLPYLVMIHTEALQVKAIPLN